MTLTAASIEWAIDFIISQSDGDLFPRLLEMEAIATQRQDFVGAIVGHSLTEFQPGASRRFIVPKDGLSYRQATQLDPQDSIILTAIIYQFGAGIEARRRGRTQVFSYRFAPSVQRGLYNSQNAWNDFWTTASKKTKKGSFLLYCDISDFYNQIYHHTVENQLLDSGLPNQAIKWIKSLLESTTAGVSRGVPVGPHPVHLLAEATLIPIDNSMVTAGMDFVRYADDILVFCTSERHAKETLGRIASIMDKQQRLTLQRHKSQILDYSGAHKLCSSMIEDRPISEDEDDVLKLIGKYAGGDPYATISYNQISEADWASINPAILESIVEDYLEQDPVDFIRLRWLYRRLTQIGHPGAINISLSRMDELGPCIASVCQYVASAQNIDEKTWKTIGSKLIAALDSTDVSSSEYLKLSLLSLFSRNAHVNHFTQLAAKFPGADSYAKREIFLAAKINGAQDWVREYKESFGGMDPWQKLAFVFAASRWPSDERRYFINANPANRPFEAVLWKWARSI